VFSQASDVTDTGIDAGVSATADGAQHAVLWMKGHPLDLGASRLGGLNSGAFGINEWGQISIQAETATPDPYGEDFCGYGTHVTCRAARWDFGLLTTLRTLRLAPPPRQSPGGSRDGRPSGAGDTVRSESPARWPARSASTTESAAGRSAAAFRSAARTHSLDRLSAGERLDAVVLLWRDFRADAETTESADRLLTAEQGATIPGVTKRWVERRARRLPFARRLSPHAVRYSESGLRRWMSNRQMRIA
jgi:hypothetical protein